MLSVSVYKHVRRNAGRDATVQLFCTPLLPTVLIVCAVVCTV